MGLQIPHQTEDRLKSWLLAASEITRALLQETDLRESLRLVVHRLREVSAADYVSISMVDPQYPAGAALVEAIDGMGSDHLSGQILLNNRQALWTQVAQSGERIISRDITQHPLFNPPDELAETMSRIGLCMYLPMAAGGNVLGVMCAGWRRGSPYEDIAAEEVPLMEIFAGEVALALQQARAQMLVVEDRDRIAKELQEVAFTRLFAIGTHLHVISGMAGQGELRRRIRGASDELDETIREIGSAIFALGEAKPGDQRPVSTQLVEEVDTARHALGFTPRLVVHGVLDNRVPTHMESRLVRAVRESLANAASHNAVSSIEVNVQVMADQLILTVSDDSQTSEHSARPCAVGWLREEAERLGGTFAVHAGVPTGTVLSWRVPLIGTGDDTTAEEDQAHVGADQGASALLPSITPQSQRYLNSLLMH